MNLALLDFEKNFLARGYVFPHQVLFCPSSFKREADFVNAVFVGPGQFSGSEFKEHARFENAVFLQAAHFSEATFCDRARFDWTEFRNGAGFGDARFLFEACFRYAEFLQSARFHKSIFKNLTWFTGAEFRSTTPKYELNFIFAECRFEKPVSFQDAEFRDSYPVFIGTEWPERVTFTARNWPPGQEERFEAERRFLWPISTEQHPETARDSCATIRHLLAKQGLPEDEHFFFRREMHFAGRIGPIWQRLPYLMFGWFSEYGYSIARPFWWLFAIWLFGTFVLAEHFVAETAQPLLGSDDWTAMALSFSNQFPVFGFGRAYFGTDFLQALPQHLKVLSGLQTVASLPLLFFLGLGLRQRFRLR